MAGNPKTIRLTVSLTSYSFDGISDKVIRDEVSEGFSEYYMGDDVLVNVEPQED